MLLPFSNKEKQLLHMLSKKKKKKAKIYSSFPTPIAKN